MSTQKKLSDLGIPAQKYESTPLSNVGGEKLLVKSVKFKELGQYDGVVMTLVNPVKVNGVEWDQVHSSGSRVIKKLKSEEFQNALKDGSIEMTVTSGSTGKGTWYDVE